MKRLIRILEDYRHCTTCDPLHAGEIYEVEWDDNYLVVVTSMVNAIVSKFDEGTLFEFVNSFEPMKTSQVKNSFLSVFGKK